MTRPEEETHGPDMAIPIDLPSFDESVRPSSPRSREETFAIINGIVTASMYPEGYVQFAEECARLSYEEASYSFRFLPVRGTPTAVQELRHVAHKLENKEFVDLPVPPPEGMIGEDDYIKIDEIAENKFAMHLKTVGRDFDYRQTLMMGYISQLEFLVPNASMMSFIYRKHNIRASWAFYASVRDNEENPDHHNAAIVITCASELVGDDRRSELFQNENENENQDAMPPACLIQ